MLYDNAQLARVYLYAWQVTGVQVYRAIVEETLDYVVREMVESGGGFYATQALLETCGAGYRPHQIVAFGEPETDWGGLRLEKPRPFPVCVDCLVGAYSFLLSGITSIFETLPSVK